MSKTKQSTIEVQGTAIAVLNQNDQDYISLTDIARYRNSQEPFAIINNWMRSRSTIEFLGLWEKLNNPGFKPLEFERFKNEAGSNYFVLSPQRWIEATHATGITSKSGRYGGTFAHRDIAFEFASWISSEFKLYLIKEFQRLKDDENRRLSLAWNLNRTLSKLNYRIHTDAIKAHLVPPEVTPTQATVYVRRVIEEALHLSAAAVVLVHNHPSGNPEPSAGDDDTTSDLLKACKLVQLIFLDHVIVGESEHYSYTDAGRLQDIDTK